VQRPELISRLSDGLERRLTLVSAPAGYGKTTLIAEWAARRDDTDSPQAVGWLSLDEGDNDLARFLTYLVAALGQACGQDAPIGRTAVGLLQSHPLPVEAILTALINDVSDVSGGIVLVLDDLHIIECRPFTVP